jgi:hypothetical protein
VRLGAPLALPRHSFVAKLGGLRIFWGRNPLRSLHLNFLLEGSQGRSGVCACIAGHSALRLGEPSAVGGLFGRPPDGRAGHESISAVGLQISRHVLRMVAARECSGPPAARESPIGIT